MPTSLVRCMSMTAGRSFLRDEGSSLAWVRLEVLCRIFASGLVERPSESTDMPSAEVSASELSDSSEPFLRFLEEGFLAAEALTHSGTGYSRVN